ncbi:UDP-N-acetyl-D-mannosamine dehydrogenase [Pseudoalteromonas piscicida]|uniref:UDP-N-acetyl-D-mannosamine dehydrogenase n=1 Tax=Pseudoalteromonas piscicida TaxID=43662 RepID=UPI00309F6D3E
MSFNTISVIGLGYIGLPTAAMFASQKRKVIGVDVNESTVNTINRGEIHIVEPELDMIVHAAVTEGYLKAVTTPEAADAFLIAVPTPFKEGTSVSNEQGIPEPDLTYVENACKAISPVLKKGDLVILESTSPVGATEKMARWLGEARPDLSFPNGSSATQVDVNIAYCPERVLPGRVVHELVENDRVIGGITKECSARAVELYKTFVVGDCVVTNARTAEMTKLTENSCRDVQIAFANELSVICDKLDINVWELISLANRHPRINILNPGPGVGGHCIAVDPWFIVSKTPQEAALIHTARKVNSSKPDWVIEKVKIALADFLQVNPTKTAKDINIVCYGLAFKADIDDLRESPAMAIASELANIHSGNTFAVEPNVTSLAHQELKLISMKDAEQSVDIALLLVDHKQFKDIKPNLDAQFIIDTRGIWT